MTQSHRELGFERPMPDVSPHGEAVSVLTSSHEQWRDLEEARERAAQHLETAANVLGILEEQPGDVGQNIVEFVYDANKYAQGGGNIEGAVIADEVAIEGMEEGRDVPVLAAALEKQPEGPLEAALLEVAAVKGDDVVERVTDAIDAAEKARSSPEMDAEALAEIAAGWHYNTDSGALEEVSDPLQALRGRERAQAFIRSDQWRADPELRTLVDEILGKEERRVKGAREADVKKLESMAAKHEVIPPRLQALLDQERQGLANIDRDKILQTTCAYEVTDVVLQELTRREKELLDHLVDARMKADLLPWTMQDSEVPQQIMDVVKDVWDDLLHPVDVEAHPDDEFRVARPMKRFEKGYTDADIELLNKAGLVEEKIGDRGQKIYAVPRLTRAGLQEAGVFFINRVGDGEQPIFGVPIPDPDSEDGLFHVQDRSFLTREEFEKVYAYQQANGFGLGQASVEDVQMDMLMFAWRPEIRNVSGKWERKKAGFGGREAKYGIQRARSPFVDLGHIPAGGVEPMILGKDGCRRMNTMSIHLANAHPDYPGVSEMFDPARTAWDQKYMSVGEFMRDFYVPPSTPQEILQSMKDQLLTRREAFWAGRLPDEVERALTQVEE